jgi:nucleoside 2-deoxyribosyltransferase
MPFRDEFADEFEIAFMEASDSNGFLCERADLSAFTGDILDWVRNRIETCSAMIALMNTANPNVFLEIGYAWAKGVPTILIVKKGEAPPFNVKGQRFIEYERIGDLRRKLTAEIASLKQQGVLSA